MTESALDHGGNNCNDGQQYHAVNRVPSMKQLHGVATQRILPQLCDLLWTVVPVATYVLPRIAYFIKLDHYAGTQYWLKFAILYTS